MARPNPQFEKRQRELEKKRKKEEKRLKKLERKSGEPEETIEAVQNESVADDATPQEESTD